MKQIIKSEKMLLCSAKFSEIPLGGLFSETTEVADEILAEGISKNSINLIITALSVKTIPISLSSKPSMENPFGVEIDINALSLLDGHPRTFEPDEMVFSYQFFNL